MKISFLYQASLLVLIIIFLYAIIFMASLKINQSNPREIARAIFSCLMKIIGITMMSIGAVPTFYSIIAPVSYSGQKYFCYLILFIIGGLIFLKFDSIIEKIENSSKIIPLLIYFYSLKTISLIITFIALISLVVSLMLPLETNSHNWTVSFSAFVYGLIFYWCIKYLENEEEHFGTFKTKQILSLKQKNSIKKAKK